MSGVSKSKVKKTDRLYLEKDSVDINIYSDYVIELIDKTDFDKYKFCNVCGEYYPFHHHFFMKEKRLPDGYENKCRKCRNGKFVTELSMSGDIGIYVLNNKLTPIQNYELFLESEHSRTNDKNFIKTNAKEILEWLIKGMSDDEVYSINREWVKNNKLYGLSIHSYDGSITKMFTDLFGDRFKPWKFTMVEKGYWQDENNRAYAFSWFVYKIINDGIIDSVDYLNTIPVGEYMNYHGLNGLYKYYSSVYDCINSFYPDKFKEYRFSYINLNLTQDKVKEWVREYVLVYKGITIDDIKYYVSYYYLSSGNLKNVLISALYREDKLFESYNHIIEYCFPELDMYEYAEHNHKNHWICKDGNIAKSSEERVLYYWMIDKGVRVEMCNQYDDRYRIYDSVNDMIMYPDYWIYHNDKIVIVEYYGYMTYQNGTFANDIGYEGKHDSKIDYYTNRLNDSKYEYIGLYPSDMKEGLKGVENKLRYKGIIE